MIAYRFKHKKEQEVPIVSDITPANNRAYVQG